MNDGQKLKTYLDQNNINKTALFTALGMSKQNLYGLFLSNEFEAETRKKFEKQLRVKWDVIDQVDISPIKVREVKVDSQDTPDNMMTVHSLAKSMELAQQTQLVDAENRKLSEENRRMENENMRRLIQLLEGKMGGFFEVGNQFPEPGTKGTKTYKPTPEENK